MQRGNNKAINCDTEGNTGLGQRTVEEQRERMLKKLHNVCSRVGESRRNAGPCSLPAHAVNEACILSFNPKYRQSLSLFSGGKSEAQRVLAQGHATG